MIKRIATVMGIVPAMCFCCITGVIASEKNVPELHQIEPVPGSELQDYNYGAYYFDNQLDQPENGYYTVNDYYNMKSEGSLHIIPHYETYQQTAIYSCGPSALLMALKHYGVNDYNELDICRMTGTNGEVITSLENMKNFLLGLGFRLEYHAGTEIYFSNMKEMERYIINTVDQNAPTLVSWVDWYGHWTSIIGIDTGNSNSPFDDVLILADSYDITDHYQDGYYLVPLARFFCMWRETTSFGKTDLYEQPFITVYDR